MRTSAILISLASAATLIALATPLDDHRAPAPLAEDVTELESLLAARLSSGLWAARNPPGALASPPDRAQSLDQYVRYYALVTVRSEEDLPFTTFEDPSESTAGFAGTRIVGVLASPDFVERPAGIVLSQTGRLPTIVHGGCSVVNVIYDPGAGRLISAWCNVPAPY